MSATSCSRFLAINHRGPKGATPSLQSQRPWPYQKFADLAEPSETDIDRTAKLDAWISENAEQDDRDEQKKKEQIIVDITNTVRKWVTSTAISKGVPRELAESAGANVHTSGSYRMGLNEKGADIDSICVCPNHVTKEDFFVTLQAEFEKNPKVTDVVSIPGAKVPMIGFIYDGVDIDLLFAQLPKTSIPRNLDIGNDEILRGVDEGTLLSLNGPRTTDLIVKSVPKQATFIKVLRCVRIWAKRRALYSNKIGFLGGVNWAILVGFVCKLYPNSSASRVLARFFWWMKEWKWPTPVMICTPVDAGLGKKMWDPKKNPYDGKDLMPIITPAYPVYNSSFNVNRSTLTVMKNEFDRAYILADRVMKGEDDKWDRVFESTDFFLRFDYYMQVTVSAKDEDNFRKWSGWVESRLRKLVENLEGTQPRNVLSGIQPYHKAVKPDGCEVACWHFIGFVVDKTKIYGKNLPIYTEYFEENEVGRWPQKTEDMQLQCQVKKWKDIPEQVHPDGMEAAKAARRIAKGKGGKSTKTDTATAKPEAESSSAPISLEPESSSAPIKIEEEESASAGKKRPLEEETAGETNAKKVKVEAEVKEEASREDSKKVKVEAEVKEEASGEDAKKIKVETALKTEAKTESA